MENIKTICPVCGREYVPRVYMVNGVRKSLQVPQCGCMNEKFNALLKFINADNRTGKKRPFAGLSELPPELSKLSFDKLEQSDAKDFARQFVQTFSPKNRGFGFIGETGRGKSTMAAVICMQLREKNFRTLFVKTSALLDFFTDSMRLNSAFTTDELLKELRSFDFVVLDDFARETYTERRLEYIFRIADELVTYEICTAFTANPEMIRRLKSENYRYRADFEAIFDRLSGLCPKIFTFKGESYRRHRVCASQER